MDLIISKTSSKPIYEQIEDEIKAAIMRGEIQPGEMLPSVRGLAKSLQISVITAKRAYEDLQKQGFVDTSVGKGTYVSNNNNNNIIREERLKEIETLFIEAMDIADKYNISLEELEGLLRSLNEEVD